MVLLPMPKEEQYASIQMDQNQRVHQIADLPAGRNTKGCQPFHYPGVQILKPCVLQQLPDFGFCDINRDGLVSLLQSEKLVNGFPTSGRWYDVGTPQRLMRATRELLALKQETYWAAATAEIDAAATIEGACVFGEGARVEANAFVKDSVLMDGAVASNNCRITESVVGYGTWVPNGSDLSQEIWVETEGELHKSPMEGPAK